MIKNNLKLAIGMACALGGASALSAGSAMLRTELDCLPDVIFSLIVEYVGKKSGVVATLQLPHIPRAMVTYGNDRVAIAQESSIQEINPERGTVIKTLIKEKGFCPPIHKLAKLMKESVIAADDSCEEFPIKVVHLLSGACPQSLPGDGKKISTIAALSQYMVAVASAHRITLRCISTKDIYAVLQGHRDEVLALAVLSDNELLASGSRDTTIKVWSKYGPCRRTLTGHKGAVNALIALPNGMLLSGSDDKDIRLWNPESEKCLLALQGHRSAVTSLVAMSLPRVASGCADGTIKLWNINSGTCLETLREHRDAICALLWCSNLLISASHDRTIKTWKDREALDGADHDYTIQPLEPSVLVSEPLPLPQPKKIMRQSQKLVRKDSDSDCIVS